MGLEHEINYLQKSRDDSTRDTNECFVGVKWSVGWMAVIHHIMVIIMW